MHDIRWIRDNRDLFDERLGTRGLESPVPRLLELDEQRRAIITRLQAVQERRNAVSKDVGQAKAAKDEARAAALIAEVGALKTAIADDETAQRDVEAELDKALAEIPNLPLPEVPVGPDEHANVEKKRWGKAPAFSFAPKQHFEIGEAWGLMDFEAAAKLSGARFVVLKGPLARMERALGQFMLDMHTTQHGYTEIAPPILVRDEAMFGTAQLPKFADDQFFATRKLPLEEREQLKEELARARFADEQPERGKRLLKYVEYLQEADALISGQDNRWLIPTAEVPLTNLVRESILSEEELPLRVTALTPCFRAEAGAAGRDTRGLIRQHQFNKVELVSITTPEQSPDEHERMLASAEAVLAALGLHYRVVTLCTGDMGFASQKTYDIEVWLPGQNAFREISSCSTCGDFQARRMGARYRPAGEKTVRHVHTLNGSGVAVGRALVAVLENYQNEDGSVEVPEVLRPYMGGLTRIELAA